MTDDAPTLELLPAALLAPTDDALDVAVDVAVDTPEEPATEDPPELLLEVPLEPPTLLAMTLEDATWDVPEPPLPTELAPDEPIPDDTTALELPARELLLTALDARELPLDTAPLEDVPPPPEEELLLLESPLLPVQPHPNIPAATVNPTTPRRTRIIPLPSRSNGNPPLPRPTVVPRAVCAC